MLTDGLRALAARGAPATRPRCSSSCRSSTPSKNKMILATRRDGRRRRRGAAGPWPRSESLKAFYGIREQCLERLLRERGAVAAAAGPQSSGPGGLSRRRATRRRASSGPSPRPSIASRLRTPTRVTWPYSTALRAPSPVARENMPTSLAGGVEDRRAAVAHGAVEVGFEIALVAAGHPAVGDAQAAVGVVVADAPAARWLLRALRNGKPAIHTGSPRAASRRERRRNVDGAGETRSSAVSSRGWDSPDASASRARAARRVGDQPERLRVAPAPAALAVGLGDLCPHAPARHLFVEHAGFALVVAHLGDHQVVVAQHDGRGHRSRSRCRRPAAARSAESSPRRAPVR